MRVKRCRSGRTRKSRRALRPPPAPSPPISPVPDASARTRRHPPPPRGRAFARDLLGGVRLLDAVGGDAVEARGPVGPGILLLRHPDLIRAVLVENNSDVTKARGLRLAQVILGHGLLTSEAPEHTRRRRLVLPAFHHAKLRGYARTMVELSVAEADRWADGETLDVSAATNRLALAVAGRTLFSADVLEHTDEIGGALRDTLRGFDDSQFPLADKLTWLPRPSTIRTKRARAVLDRLVYRLIAERRASGTDAFGDLLSMLIDARDEDTGEALTDEEIRDEAMTLLLAGHETTAVALAWTFALLARNPGAEARLFAEVDALGEAPSFDTLRQLPVTRQTFAEAMRLRPPAWTVGREAARDCTHWRDRRPARDADPVRAAVRAAGPALLGPAARVRPGAVHGRGEVGAAQVCLRPVQRRPTRLHRRAVRLDRRHAASGDAGAALAAPARRAGARDARIGDAAHEQPALDARRGAVTEGRGQTRLRASVSELCEARISPSAFR